LRVDDDLLLVDHPFNVEHFGDVTVLLLGPLAASLTKSGARFTDVPLEIAVDGVSP
jgi:hypothetical protein